MDHFLTGGTRKLPPRRTLKVGFHESLTHPPFSANMEGMEYITRQLEKSIRHDLSRGKSVLLLGPRQTGKSTMLSHIDNDFLVSLVLPRIRQRYEKDPSLLQGEVTAIRDKLKRTPLVVLDEVQKVPGIMDVVQEIIDRNEAQFILTGSSARKLKRGGDVNLLPGRLVVRRLDPFVYQETVYGDITRHLLYGSLPGIFQTKDDEDKETDLRSYVETYLEEEVRAEALVRHMGHFHRFLEYAGLESGNIVSFRALSQDIGVSHTTIAAYFQILEDCLVAERIEPITHSTTRKKLTKSSRYLLFDLGVRRLCAGEGIMLTPDRLGQLFEQYVGLELAWNARLLGSYKVRYWRDPDGPEVDWVLEKHRSYIPIEVKWTDSPNRRHAKHVLTFIGEYPESEKGYIVCRTNKPVQLHPQVTAIPWEEINSIFTEAG